MQLELHSSNYKWYTGLLLLVREIIIEYCQTHDNAIAFFLKYCHLRLLKDPERNQTGEICQWLRESSGAIIERAIVAESSLNQL